MVELSEMIRELRHELSEAIAEGEGEQLRFRLGPVELELLVAVERSGSPSAKVRFWVVELGAEGTMRNAVTQRITLTLEPRMADSDAPPLVSGSATDRER